MNWIVVADSSASTLNAAGQILCKQKMRVTGLKHAEALLNYLRQNRPDLILMGSVMGELGGFEAIDALKRGMGPDADVPPVLLMTDRVDPDFEAGARSAGAAGVVGMPLSPVELTDKVRELLAARGRPAGDDAAAGVSNLEEISSSRQLAL